MNYLWGGMLLVGILYGAFTGNLNEVTDAVINSSREAVSLCITVAGVTALWCGIMKIAENTGLIASLTRKTETDFAFPVSLYAGRPSGRRSDRHKYDCQCTRTWVGGDTGRPEGHGGAGGSGGCQKSRKSSRPGSKERNRQQ